MNTETRRGYLLGIGSNLSPESNIADIIDALLEQFSSLAISRVLRIPPVGMNSQHDFLNLAAFIETDLDSESLKAFCNGLEVRLGRDRHDPASKTKDRPADLDILLHIENDDDFNTPANQITDEYFLYPLIDELLAFLSDQPLSLRQPGTAIQLGALTFGESATTIYRDATSGQERVL